MRIVCVAAAALGMGLSACNPATREVLGRAAQDWLAAEGAVPAASPEIAFTDDRDFDVQMYASLGALEDVHVNIPETHRSSGVPERVQDWIGWSRRSGGQVRLCDVQTGAGFAGWWAVLLELGKIGYRVAQTWALYRPADNRDVIVEFDSADQEVVGARFLTEGRLATVETSAGYRQCRDYR